MTTPYDTLMRMPPPGWKRLTPDQFKERADTILFLRRRAGEVRDQGRADAADELELMANMLVGGGHEGCYGRHSVPPPEGWETCYGG